MEVTTACNCLRKALNSGVTSFIIPDNLKYIILRQVRSFRDVMQENQTLERSMVKNLNNIERSEALVRIRDRRVRLGEFNALIARLVRSKPISILQMHALLQVLNDVSDSKPVIAENSSETVLALKGNGNPLHSAGDFPGAVEKYNECLKLSSNNIDRTTLLKNRAAAYLSLREYHKVVEDTTAVLEMTPSDITSLYYRCQAYEQLGKYQDAFADAKAVNHLNPKFSAIQPYLMRLQKIVKIVQLVLKTRDYDENKLDKVVYPYIEGQEEPEETPTNVPSTNAAKSKENSSSASESSKKKKKQTSAKKKDDSKAIPKQASIGAQSSASLKEFYSNVNQFSHESLLTVANKTPLATPVLSAASHPMNNFESTAQTVRKKKKQTSAKKKDDSKAIPKQASIGAQSSASLKEFYSNVNQFSHESLLTVANKTPMATPVLSAASHPMNNFESTAQTVRDFSTRNIHAIGGIFASPHTMQVITQPSGIKVIKKPISSVASSSSVQHLSVNPHQHGQMRVLAPTSNTSYASSITATSKPCFDSLVQVASTATKSISTPHLFSPLAHVSPQTLVGVSQSSDGKSLNNNAAIPPQGSSGSLNLSQGAVLSGNMTIAVKNNLSTNSVATCASHSNMITTLHVSKTHSQVIQPSTQGVDALATEKGGNVRKKLRDIPLVVKSLNEVAETLLIDLHFLLFSSSADSDKVKDNILEFDGFQFSTDSEEYDERNDLLQRMSDKMLTYVARAFSIGVMSKREETIQNILSFLMKPDESYLRASVSVPVILSNVELDDKEGFKDSDESITYEVVKKKDECIDLQSQQLAKLKKHMSDEISHHKRFIQQLKDAIDSLENHICDEFSHYLSLIQQHKGTINRLEIRIEELQSQDAMKDDDSTQG